MQDSRNDRTHGSSWATWNEFRKGWKVRNEPKEVWPHEILIFVNLFGIFFKANKLKHLVTVKKLLIRSGKSRLAARVLSQLASEGVLSLQADGLVNATVDQNSTAKCKMLFFFQVICRKLGQPAKKFKVIQVGKTIQIWKHFESRGFL